MKGPPPPGSPSPPASQGGGQDRRSQAGALLAVVGRMMAPKLSNPSPQKCDYATLHGKRDFTDAISKDVKTGVYPGSPGRPGGVTKALGRQRQQARVREVMTEAEVTAGLCKQRKGPQCKEWRWP